MAFTLSDRINQPFILSFSTHGIITCRQDRYNYRRGVRYLSSLQHRLLHCLQLLQNFLQRYSGINLSFARALLTKHCNVVFADLALRPEAQELVSSHANHSQSPAKAVFQKTDCRDWQDLERMFHVASKEFGGADIVCPGAGVYEPVRIT